MSDDDVLIECTSEWTLMKLNEVVVARLDQSSYHLFSEENIRGQVFNLDVDQKLKSMKCEGNVLLTTLRGSVEVCLNNAVRRLPRPSQLIINPGTTFSLRATESSSVQFIWAPPFSEVEVLRSPG